MAPFSAFHEPTHRLSEVGIVLVQCWPDSIKIIHELAVGDWVLGDGELIHEHAMLGQFIADSHGVLRFIATHQKITGRNLDQFNALVGESVSHWMRWRTWRMARGALK